MELQTDAYERVWSHELQKSDDVVGGGGGDGGGCDENADRKGRGGSRNRDLIRRSNSRRSVLIDSDQAQGETHTNGQTGKQTDTNQTKRGRERYAKLVRGVWIGVNGSGFGDWCLGLVKG